MVSSRTQLKLTVEIREHLDFARCVTGKSKGLRLVNISWYRVQNLCLGTSLRMNGADLRLVG